MQAIARSWVFFLAQGLPFDFQLDDLTFNNINVHGQCVHFHAEARRGFINQVDGLVRQETIGDVAMRKHRSRDDCRILDLHAMMDFVALLQSAKNGNRVFDGGLADIGLLKSSFEGFVLLDVFLIFVQRGCADATQIATCQCGLQHIGSIHRSFGSAGADQRVQFVDEQNDVAAGFFDFLEDGLQTVFKFAAILRSGNHRAKIQRDDSLMLEGFRNVAGDNSLRQAFNNCGLSYSRLANQYGIVFGSSGENLNDAPHFFVTADDRIEFAFARKLRQIARIALQRLIFFFGIRICDLLAAANGNQNLENAVFCDALGLQQARNFFALGVG